jgi:hypothetical protein
MRKKQLRIIRLTELHSRLVNKPEQVRNFIYLEIDLVAELLAMDEIFVLKKEAKAQGDL